MCDKCEMAELYETDGERESFIDKDEDGYFLRVRSETKAYDNDYWQHYNVKINEKIPIKHCPECGANLAQIIVQERLAKSQQKMVDQLMDGREY